MNNSKIAMHGFFIHGFPKLMRFQQHHDKVMRKFLPRLVTFINHRWRCCLIIQILLLFNFVYIFAGSRNTSINRASTRAFIHSNGSSNASLTE